MPEFNYDRVREECLRDFTQEIENAYRRGFQEAAKAMAQKSRPVNVVQGGAEFDVLEPEGDYWGDQLESDEVVVSGLGAPPSHSANRVIANTTDTGTRSGGRPIKPSGVTNLPLLMMTMCCLIGCIGAERYVPQQPVLCDGLMDLSG